jgi:hypothetical protein
MSALTATQARVWMGDAMDARALNMRQHHMLVNQTPETDCLTDHLLALVHREGVKPSRVLELLRTTRDIVELNAEEGGLSMKLAGELDQLATSLHDLETSGQRRELTVKDIGRALRGALPVLADPAAHSMAQVVQAGAAVHRIVSEVPAAQLLSASVRKELRDTNYQRLLALYAEQHEQEERVA